ncbi:RNA 2',3'-cyclic phosphodiesterase [Candidatus Nitrospira neomarina]|uniref:RNA 2',3'-cyclic phosphodiesterase n=1 Tax=Candidatus Nitrospira neomarina TaxID=3020899 RepID=A0AA96JWM4_9BACT|nr:RNA 2',3'-cyclic phosphodiesterase [Candidatus Nitrospira neomarina]WNM62982.1 RNA 2',3'-cyclic phosphodiesterase [Candidatus Nitrospira neomarina]
MNRFSNQKSLRVFLAVELSLDLRRKVVELQCQLRESLPMVNWVRPESIHLTLKFLGYVDASLVEPVLTAIEPIRTSQPPLTLEVQGLGVFPHLRRPRVLWIGCTGDIPALFKLVSRIEGAMEPLGFPPEDKPYFPHLTLARIKHDQSQVGGVLTHSGLLEQPRNLGIFHVDRITLFRSDVSQSGAEYTALRTVPFTEPGSHNSI